MNTPIAQDKTKPGENGTNTAGAAPGVRRRRLRLMTLGAACLPVLIVVAGCLHDGGDDDDGLCITPSMNGTQSDICREGWESGECRRMSDSTYQSGSSCPAAGFTARCSGDAAGVYHRSRC